MERIESFSFRRLWLLLRREAMLSWRTAAIGTASVAGFVIIVSFLSALGGEYRAIHDSIFTSVLFIGGWAVASLAFREVRQTGQGVAYLTLPGSALEKLAAKLLAASAGWAVGVSVAYTIVAAISEALNRLILGGGHPFFDPLRLVVLEQLAVFVVTQSAFFLGSIWFRKSAFVKTWLAAIVYVIVFIVLAILVTRLAFADLSWVGFSLGPSFRVAPGPDAALLESRLHPFVVAFKVLFWAALAPVCWVTGWLRLRETEV